jgi:hypothetical protein
MSVTNYDNESEDYIVDQAIAKGLQQAAEAEAEAELEVALEFNDEQLKKIQQLAVALELSVTALLDTAVGYVYFNRDDEEVKKMLAECVSKAKKNSVKDEYNQKYAISGAHIKKLMLTALVAHKLEVLGMTDNVYECVATGINLLYERLITHKTKVAC